MPAVSKSQQRLFGMAYSYKKGESDLEDFPEGVRDQIRRMADDMTLSKLKDFAETDHDGLPDKVEESSGMTKSEFYRRVEKRLVESYDPTGSRALASKLEEAFPKAFGKSGKYDAKRFLWNLSRTGSDIKVERDVIRAAMAEVIFEAQKLTKAELGLTAPEGADYEIERTFEGNTINRAFMNAWDWASGNQYEVTFEGESKEDGNISDWTFSKDGSEQKLVRL
jgi:hypothetical protein